MANSTKRDIKRISRVVVLAAALSSGLAVAGMKWSDPLQIDFTNLYAQGDQAGIRANSASEYIYCSVSATANVSEAFCAAYDGTNWVYCASTAPWAVAAAYSVGADGFLYFSWLSNTNHDCTQIEVERGSAYAPKQP